MPRYSSGTNVAASPADFLVNTVNTVGVMGKGVALDIKNAFPGVLEPYRKACDSGRLQPGTFHLFRASDRQVIVNLATKRDWRDNSRYEWVGAGLVYLNRYLIDGNHLPASMCMPMPGCGNGGLDAGRVQQMMRIYLHRACAAGLDLEICASRQDGIDDPVFFAGVGSRETPEPVLSLMEDIGAGMTEAGYRLRSGGAIGADTAFWRGCKSVNPSGMEIFLTKPKEAIPGGIVIEDPIFDRLAINFHPAPLAITPDPNYPNDRRVGVLKLMARNGNQVFGTDFTNPSNALICWTKGGSGKGGTGQAIRLARSTGIPVIDLGLPEFENAKAHEVVDLAIAAIRNFRVERDLPVGDVEVEPVIP